MCSISIKPSNKEPIAKAVGSFFAQKKSRRVAHTTNNVFRRVLWCTCVAQQCANVGSAGKAAVQEHCWKECGSAAVHRCSAPVLGAISCQLKRRKQAESSMKAAKRAFEKPYAWSQWFSFAPFSCAKN